MKKTNAARILDRHQVSYELLPYDYDAGDLSVEQIAETNDLPVAQVFKTLVVKGDRTGVMVAVVPGDKGLNFKSIAEASNNKKVAMVPLKDLQGLTGYIRGGCSPLGMKKDYPVFLDRSALDHEFIYVNAGARGMFLKVNPEALREVAGATVAAIAT